jgi:branched-chain amino acid transport system ATP-binding protein
MLDVQELVTGYGRAPALHGVSLTVAAGEIVAVIGANGAGKTTLMKAIAGLLPAWGGEITISGQRMNDVPAFRRVKSGVALSPEGRRVFGPLSVSQNLQLGAHHRVGRRNSTLVAEDLDLVFSLFPVLKERAQQRADTLSGGEQQMLAIGRALMGRPRLLLLDEPSLGLAPIMVDRIFESLAVLNDHKGISVLLVEQNASMALALADRAYVLDVGRVAVSGTAAELEHDPRVREAYLTAGLETH